MIVKKVAADWAPHENPYLAVGETIEITDPKQLIIDGKVVALDANGAEISAYEMYGVMIQSEVQDFEEYLKLKKQESLQKQLDKENAALQAKLDEQKAKEEAEAAAQPVVETPAPEAPKTDTKKGK